MTMPRTPASPHSSTRPGARLRRRDDDREVDRLADRGDGRIGLDAEDRRPGRVDRVDRAAERRGQQVPQDRPPDRPFLLGGADDRDRARMEERVERMALDVEEVGRRVGREGGCWGSESGHAGSLSDVFRIDGTTAGAGGAAGVGLHTVNPRPPGRIAQGLGGRGGPVHMAPFPALQEGRRYSASKPSSSRLRLRSNGTSRPSIGRRSSVVGW